MCAATQCPPGTFVSCAGKKSCDPCPAGRYCPVPTSSFLCPAGSYCPAGATAPADCPANTASGPGASDVGACQVAARARAHTHTHTHGGPAY